MSRFFKKGDRVILSNVIDPTRPFGGNYTPNTSNTIGNTGVVRSASDFIYEYGKTRGLPVSVLWDNGKSNSYCHTNLILEDSGDDWGLTGGGDE